jgi:glycosyltransferase involved in cell wall biosynthesis
LGVEHVHVHSCGDAANVALFANQLSELSYSVTLHNPIVTYGPNQPQKWRHARFAIVITNEILSEVEEQLHGALPEKVYVAPMGVDEHAFRRIEPYEPYSGSGRFRIFSCSRLNPGKAVDDLIRALADLTRRGLNAELRIAGSDDVGGGYRRELEALATEMGVADRTHFLGSVSEAEVLRELRNAHAFALASLAEPLGIAIAEAMAVEVPVVATRAGGVPNLVDDGHDGLLVAPRAPDEIADALEQIATDSTLASALSSRSREKVTRSFHSGISARVIHEAAGATP